MTDNEIIKALELCTSTGCETACPMFDNGIGSTTECRFSMLAKALSIINRQKAEIESQREYLNVSKIRAEAIKEFAERLKERKYLSSEWSHGEHPYVVEESDIDDVLDEMVGE